MIKSPGRKSYREGTAYRDGVPCPSAAQTGPREVYSSRRFSGDLVSPVLMT